MMFLPELMKATLIAGLLAGLGMIATVPYAAAQQTIPRIPSNNSPGAILQHDMQDADLQREQPWLTRPIGPTDTQPMQPEQPLIEYRGFPQEPGAPSVLPGLQQPAPIRMRPNGGL